MSYTIEFSRKAERQFRDLPRSVQLKIAPKIGALAETPRPRSAKKLEGQDDIYRIRVGDYHIIYQVQDKALIVLVVKIGDRREVYRYIGK
ncbi:MAG: type II toxin-antitoxin system RelE/ParE family toxin [Blastocatellia bacterium]